MALIKDKQVFGWVMYDWANSAFATTVMAGFFPVFFKSYWSAGSDVNTSTAMLGYANSLASLMVALISPILGAIADQSSSKKRFLIFFAYLGALMTTCLFVVEYGNWLLAAFLYVMGTVGFSGANTFYDGLLPEVTTEKKIDYVSAKGYALGYLGGGLLFLVNVLWYLKPTLFGFPVEVQSPVMNELRSGTAVVIIAPGHDFSLPQNATAGQAIVTSEITLPLEITETVGENQVGLQVHFPEGFAPALLDSTVTFGKYKRGTILSLDVEESMLTVGALTRNLSPTDSIHLTIKNPITYANFRDGQLLGVTGLGQHYLRARVKTDFLPPAREFLPIRLSFLSVGFWWALFTIPLIRYIQERRKNGPDQNRTSYVRLGFGQLTATFRKIRHLKVIFIFLLAYWMYIDGVDTIIKMAVDYGMSIGFPSSSLIIALLMVQFIGFPAALIFGKLAEKWNAKKALFITIAVYLGVTAYSVVMDEVFEFYLLAVVIALVQGGIQALSRSYFSRLIPRGQSAEFYGFYNMLGKFSVIFGPLLIGSVGLLVRHAGYTSDTASRAGIGSVSILFLLGAIFLYFVDEEKGKQEVKHLQDQ